MDQKTTEVEGDGDQPDIAYMRVRQKAEYDGGKKVRHLCDDQKSPSGNVPRLQV